MISFLLGLLALFSAGLTWRQFTSVASQHRHRIIYSCGHRSSRPIFPSGTGTGQDPVNFGLLALFGLPAGHRSIYRKIGSWHRSGTGLWATGAPAQDRDYGTGKMANGRTQIVLATAGTAAFLAPVFSIWTFTLLSGVSLVGGSLQSPDRISVLRAGAPGQLIIIVLISYIDCTGRVMIQSLWTLYQTPID